MARALMKLERPYVFRTRKTAEDACWFPLPPSCVLFDHKMYYAFWLVDEEHDYEYTASGNCRFYLERLDLRYSYADWFAASLVADDIVARIMTQSLVPNAETKRRELDVIAILRKAGMSQDAIRIIFREQAIGDQYRDTGSLIGSLSMADELLQDVLAHYEIAGFPYWKDKHTFWFNLTGALRWWYPHRRQVGLRILPENELRALLKTNPGGYWLGKKVKRAGGEHVWTMWGVDLKMAQDTGGIHGNPN